MKLGEIRPAELDEVEALSALKRRTFRETFLDEFGIPYPPADLALFETEMYAPGRIAAELRDPDHRTWVVGDHGAPVAYAHLGPCKLPHPEAKPPDTELYQLYVAREAQGSGLGRALLDCVLDPAVTAIAAPSWLGVWSGNVRAQRLYASRGFEHVGRYDFPVGTWLDEEYVFRRMSP